MSEKTLESILAGPSIIRERWLSTEDAVREVVAFERRFGSLHLWLACHAALPLIVSPELVNLIRINFLDGWGVPWIAESDFLLSPLCRPIDEGLFDVEPGVREVLLMELENQFGLKRQVELADFLDVYLHQKPNRAWRRDVVKLQKMIAQAYLSPGKLIEEIRGKLDTLDPQEDHLESIEEQLRLVTLVELTREPFERVDKEGYQSLLKNSQILAFKLYEGTEAVTQAIAQSRGNGSIHWQTLPIAPGLLARLAKLESSIDESREPEQIQPWGGMRAVTDVTDVLIRILPKNNGAAGYPIELILDGEQHFSDQLSADIVPWIPGGNITADGQRLYRALFASSKLLEGWAEARRNPSRRVRLWIEPLELQTIPWEILHDGQAVLAANESTPFSRYLPSETAWGTGIVPYPLKVLGVISNPQDLDKHHLTPLDRAIEEQTLREALDVTNIQLDFLEPPVTLERLEERLHQGYHVVHYVGHGLKNKKGKHSLVFESAGRDLHRVTAEGFVALLQRQSVSLRPDLLFLSACYSAENPVTDSFQGMAQQAVVAGVPFVIAMQDQVSIATARDFSQKFYQELLALDGRVDQALNQARSLLLSVERSDATVPVLFMRLKDAKLFTNQVIPPYEFESSFVGRETELKQLQQGLVDYPVAFVHGMAGSGKNWLARQLATRMGFDEQATIEIKFQKDEGAYQVWTGIAAELRAKGVPQFEIGLEGGKETEKGDWAERGTRLADILRQRRFLVILDNLHNADLQKDVEGWRALFRVVTEKRLTEEITSRFLLLSQQNSGEFFKVVSLEPGRHLTSLALRDLSKEAVYSLARHMTIQLSTEEMDALYACTGGHAQSTRLALNYMRGKTVEARQEFLEQLTERKGTYDPGDPIVKFLLDKITLELAKDEKTVCDLLSVARSPLAVDILEAASELPLAGEIVSILYQKSFTEWRDGGYVLHNMMAQVFKGDLPPDKLLQLNMQLGEVYREQGATLEAVYYFMQAERYAESLELLLTMNIHQLPHAALDELCRNAEVLWRKLVSNSQYAGLLYELALKAGQASERLSQYDKAVRWYEDASGIATTEQEEARALIYRAWVEHRTNTNRLSVDELLTEAETILRGRPEYREDLALLYLFKSRIWGERGNLTQAQFSFDAVFNLLSIPASATKPAMERLAKRQPEMIPILAQAYNALGWAYHNSDEVQATKYLEWSRMLYEQIGNKWMVGVLWNRIGANFRTWGKFDAAQSAFDNAIEIADELGDQVFIRPLVLTNKAIMRMDQGISWSETEQFLRSARDLMRQSGNMPNYSIVLETLGRLLARAGKWDEAEAIAAEYSRYAQRIKDRIEMAFAQRMQAELALLRIEAGISSCEQQKYQILTLTEFESELAVDYPYETADLWIFKAEYALLCGDLKDAQEKIEYALELYTQEQPESFIGPKLREVRARILASVNRKTEACADFKKSQHLQADYFLRGHAFYCYAKAFPEDLEASENMKAALQCFESLPAAWLAYEAWLFLNPEVDMMGITPETYKQLWIALLRCGPFAIDSALQEVFEDKSLAPWRDRLPQASSPSHRVQQTIAFLFQQRADNGENMLAVFLRCLSRLEYMGDACRGELLQLANKL